MRNFILTLVALVFMANTAGAFTALQGTITENGMNQGDLVKYLGNVRDAVNELITDHATNKTLMDELKLDLDRATADLVAARAAIVGITAKLDADGGVTDTNYAALWDPAALTGTTISVSSAATLTNNTALALTP